MAMIDAVARDAGEADATAASLFSVAPAGVRPDEDFSFLVIGDPGEGDASQHALRDQVILAARQEDVKFLVIASDVIYPSGEMKDYEPNFYLPFKGVEKPIYAIPGQPRLVQRAGWIRGQPDAAGGGARRDLGARGIRPAPVEHHRGAHRRS